MAKEMRVEDDEYISWMASSRAIRLLCEAFGMRRPAVSSLDDDSEVYLYWISDTKAVNLICYPEEDKPSQIYRREGRGNDSVSTMFPATPEALARELAWFSKKEDDHGTGDREGSLSE